MSIGNSGSVILGNSVERVAVLDGWTSMKGSVRVVFLKLNSPQSSHIDDRSSSEVSLEGDLKGKG